MAIDFLEEESAVMRERIPYAVVPVQPYCPKCGSALASPIPPGRVDVTRQDVECDTCVADVHAYFWVTQRVVVQ